MPEELKGKKPDIEGGKQRRRERWVDARDSWFAGIVARETMYPIIGPTLPAFTAAL